MHIRNYISIILLGITFSLSGQGIINDQPKLIYANERTLGGFLNSNGIGADFRFARQLNVRNDRLYGVSFDYLKHPKEYKSVVAYEFYTRRFVYGKLNHIWEIKGHIGNQHELFRKYDFSSISIRMFYTGGISLAFEKPIYYEILYYNNSGTLIDRIETQKFDASIHEYNYGGNAPFTRGLSEIKVVPGLNVRAGFNFEYSEREPIVHALEAGISATVYPRKLDMMAAENSQFFFFNMFVGYRFGTLIDISEAAQARSKREQRRLRREAGVPVLPRIR